MQARSKHKKDVRLLDLFCRPGHQSVVDHLAEQAHIRADRHKAFLTERNTFCISYIFHGILSAAVRACVVKDRSFEIDHIAAAGSVLQARDPPRDDRVDQPVVLKLLQSAESLSRRDFSRLQDHFLIKLEKTLLPG